MADSKSPSSDAAPAGSPTADASSPNPDAPAKSLPAPGNGAAPATPDETAKPGKPGRLVKPNAEAFKTDLAAKETEYEEVMKKFKDIKAKMDLAMPRNKDGSSSSPTQTRRQELLASLRGIRDKQAGGKNARVSQQDQITRLNDQVKNRIAEQKVQRSKVPFKSVDELDSRIADLDTQINGGMMKLVDEKKALVEISNLRKTKKMFAQFEDGEKQINDLKAQVKKLKEEMENPEQKALSDRYAQIQADLDELKKQQDDVNSNRNTLRSEYNQLRDQQQELWVAIKALKDDFYARDRAWKAQRDQDKKAEQERYQMERKLERAKKMLEEASDPAFLEEIRRANSLLYFFDPASKDAAQSQKSPLLPDKGLAAEAQRKVDDSAIKGMRLVSKQDRDDEYLPAKAKGKKGKKHHGNNQDASKTFNCPPSVMEDCSFLKIEPPMSAADVPSVVDQIKAKLDKWKADQAEQTSKNMEKAKREIERLEAEEAKGASTNGTQSKDGPDGPAAVAETTEAIKDVSLEDKTEGTKSEEIKPEAEAVAA